MPKKASVSTESKVDYEGLGKIYPFSKRTFERWVESGCPSLLMGKRVFRPSEVEAWVLSQNPPPNGRH